MKCSLFLQIQFKHDVDSCGFISISGKTDVLNDTL